MKQLLSSVGALLCAVGITLAALSSPTTGLASGRTPKAYIPFVSVPAAPAPLAGCVSTGQSYGSLPIVGSPTNIPAAQDPDLNLDLRGWATAPGNPPLGLVSYNGSPDPSAPQLSGFLGGLPSFTSPFEVYNWDWSANAKGSLDTMWPVTLLGMGTRPGQEVSVPPSGYAIGQGYEVLVLYATNHQITLTYTGNDNIVYGYSLHVENICVDPSLQALYDQLNAAGRGRLPALRSGQPFGRANGSEIQVAIRDTGTFMDPRSQRDWWQGY